MKQENQNLPAEYVPVVNMVKKEESIRKGINSLKKKILVSAGEEFESWKEEKQNQFFERTIIAIAKDEKLIPCFQSPEGKLSIIEAVEKAVSTGLQIGGKHAYLVPQPKKTNRKDENGKDLWITEVRFSIRDRGYFALLCGGKKPIFLDLRWGQVYEKDECSINKGNGQVEHNVCIAEDKGKFIGAWVQAKKMNGQLEVEFYSKSKIDQWRDSSKAYQSALKCKNDTPWLQWDEEMGLGAAIRHFCSRYEEARELLTSAIYDDDSEEPEDKSTVENINEALNKTEPDLFSDEIGKKSEDEKVKQPEKKKTPEEELDIF